MEAIKMERIVKTYYDALAEGKVLGRKCTACGHIEYPPYLACNECGNLDTEWVDLTDVRAHVTQILPALKVFPETQFKKKHGGYMAICVQIENADPYVTSLLHVPDERYQELHDNLENVLVKPFIIQKDDMNVVEWVLADYEGKPEDDEAAEKPVAAAAAAAPVAEDVIDEIAEKVIQCAAEGYEVDASEITLATDIREDLSNQSMKMIVMISAIEDELGVTIDIPDAGNMNTIRDFVIAVKERLGISTETAMGDAAAVKTAEAGAGAAGEAEELDEIAEKVILCAAEGYDVEPSEITLATDIREDLSNQSMKMIVMISAIEESLGVTIDIPDAANMNTIRDFVQAVKDRM